MRKRFRLFGALLLVALVSFQLHAAAPSVIVGKVRVQLLSDSLVRLEESGPHGFEDRVTFHVVNRDWPGVSFSTNADNGRIVIHAGKYLVFVATNAASLKDAEVQSSYGESLFKYTGTLENSKWLPGPAEHPKVWSFADTPRVVPPAWGLTPAPTNDASPTSGWITDNDAPDVYVFVPDGDYRRLRRDFLKLTGPTEMPPLYAFGAFDSRWYDYSEATALRQIEDYRTHKIPLDVLVVDTGWRKGASDGYVPNTNLFPNMSRFFREAHDKNVRVMFNDHPDPVSKQSLAPEELNFRYNGLSGLLEKGLDIWWYDRNWHTSLVPPGPNLHKEVWGMRMYHDMTARAKPGLRPMIMANVDGIDNGKRNRPPDVSAHRFPIQWTGDIHPQFDYLRYGVENAVHSGVQSLFPYMSDDLGGHTATPTTELYIRWIEFGALSPVYRPHCTYNLQRMPWAFGPEAERIARRFVNMRYRLLPVWYAAARENYETGEPLLRRLDLDYPQFAEAAHDDEYLIGKGILVVPVMTPISGAVPADWLRDGQNARGLTADYFNNDHLDGQPVLERHDETVDFDWGGGSPDASVPKDHFSARWTGTITVPASVGDVDLSALVDDGVRVWVDDQQVIDAWGAHDSVITNAATPLTAGKTHALRVEYQELTDNARVRLMWRSATNNATGRSVWIPPGNWISAWTGEVIKGPVTVTNYAALDQDPIYVRTGTLLPLAPEMQFTGEHPWNPITLDIYPGGTAAASLYEDDTLTTAYQRGEFRKTRVTAAAIDKSRTVEVVIGNAEGHYTNAPAKRSWILRVRRPLNWPANLTPKKVSVNGKKLTAPVRRLARNPDGMPFGDPTGAPDADTYEITLPETDVTASQNVSISFE